MTEPGHEAREDASAATDPRRDRRRIAIVAVISAILVVGALLAGAGAMVRHGQSHNLQPAAQALPKQPPSLSPSRPAPTASAGTPSSSSSPAATAAAARGTAGPTSTSPVTHRTTPTPGCTPRGVADMVSLFNNGDAAVGVRVDGVRSDQLCPGERVRVFWATYHYDTDGVAHLTGSQVYWLDHSQPVAYMHLFVEPDACQRGWFIAHGNDPIPDTLPKGVVPFEHKLNWDYPALKSYCS